MKNKFLNALPFLMASVNIPFFPSRFSIMAWALCMIIGIVMIFFPNVDES